MRAVLRAQQLPPGGFLFDYSTMFTPCGRDPQDHQTKLKFDEVDVISYKGAKPSGRKHRDVKSTDHILIVTLSYGDVPHHEQHVMVGYHKFCAVLVHPQRLCPTTRIL